MIKECPICKSSDIKASDNFCKICGLDLRKIATQEEKIQE